MPLLKIPDCVRSGSAFRQKAHGLHGRALPLLGSNRPGLVVPRRTISPSAPGDKQVRKPTNVFLPGAKRLVCTDNIACPKPALATLGIRRTQWRADLKSQ